MKLEKCSLLAIVVILLSWSTSKVGCLFVIPSMIMAMTGGLLMGKMTMGGLLMMLMAANQQQNGQNFLRNLGLIPHPSPSTGISVPSLSSDGLVQDLIVRRRRDISNTSTTFKSKQPLHGLIDEQTQYRIMREVAGSDPLSCLPQALCGISATPPSTQSTFLNDYAYLLKTVFKRDDDLDDKDLDAGFDDLKIEKPSSKKKTAGEKTKLKEKKKQSPSSVNDDEAESSEEGEVDERDIESLRKKEAVEMEDIANEEILNDDPDFMPYAMRDSMKVNGHGSYNRGPPPQEPQGPPRPPPDDEFSDFVPPGNLHQMSEAQLDEMLSKLGGPPPPQRPGSLFSKIMPTLSLGFTGKGNTKFDEDPFFAGFKRSMAGRKLEVDSASVRPATREEEVLFAELRLRRQMRREYIEQKRKELAEVQDPVEKFRIAAEFGQKLKSPRQCRLLFNSCPFSYTQVLGMVSDFRKAIMGQPINEPQKDTVVDLKPTGSKNVFNLDAAATSAGGVTSIVHQLPSGEKVEINLKMTKGGMTAVSKPGSSNSAKVSNSDNNGKKKPGNNSDLFDDDNHDNAEPVSAHSIESLKATMMAIEKINNVTVQRKKQGKPISYSHVVADLASFSKQVPNSNETTNNNITTEDVKLPEPNPSILIKLQTQNIKPKKSNNPQKTASLLASSLTKVEDDEADDTLPTSILGIKRHTSTGPKTNQELIDILTRLKQAKLRKPVKHADVDIDGDDDQADGSEDDDEDADDEEDEINDMNKMYKSEPMDDDEEGRHRRLKKRHHQIQNHDDRRTAGNIQHQPTHFLNRMTSPILRNTNLRWKNIRKPRKLFLGYDTDLPRNLPL